MIESECDIIIECGFKKIEHKIDFNPATLVKAKALVKANHVNKVKEYCVGGVGQLITASVIPTTSASKNSYPVSLTVIK